MSKLLIVEDSPTQAEHTRMLVEEFGHEVDVAPDAETGLEMLKRGKFDLVLSDIVMPGMSGFELCKAIRTDSALKDKPVILVTSLDEPKHMIEALAAGADNYITKPFKEEYLSGRIQSLLLSRGLRESGSFEMEVDVTFLGQHFIINSDRKQILGILISTLEDIFHTNQALQMTQSQLTEAHERIKAYAHQLEGQVRVTEEKYRTLMARASDAILLIGENGSILEANLQAEFLLGFPSEALVGRKTLEFIHQDDAERADSLSRQLEDTRKSRNAELHIVRPDGSERWVEATAMETELDGRKVRMAIMRDVTERREQQQLLKESEEKYRNLVESSLQGVLIIQDGKFAFCNDRFAEFYGYQSAQQLIGQEAIQLLHPDDRDRALEVRHRLLSGELESGLFQYRGIRVDGSTVWLESMRQRILWNGKTAVHGAVMDVTERVKQEARIRESEERYRDLIENWVIGIQIVQDNTIAFCNRRYAEMHGYDSPDELVGQDPAITLHPEERGAIVAAREATIVGEMGPMTQDRRAIRKDGSEFRVQASRQRIMWKGRPAAQGSLLDITKAYDLEQQLQVAQRMESIGQLAGGVAHDFNNILAVISAHSGFLLDQLPEGGDAYEDAKIIQESGARAAALTRQLLAFSRKQVMQLKVIDANETLKNLEKMLRRLIGEDIELKTCFGKNLHKVRGDESQIEQIILNLVVNARDAMPKGGKLTVETGNEKLDNNYVKSHIDVEPGEYLMLAVTDTGTGMDEKTRKRIFEPFFTTKPLGKGTGLGLATVYGIVKQMKGGIFVYSELGKGTTFKIYLPATSATSVQEQETAAPQDVAGSETILIVEDDVLVRRAAVRILKGNGYNVIESTSPEHGLELVKSQGTKIHLLVTDVIMPGMSGRDLWEQVQAIRATPVLFMSGYTDDAIVNHGILEGRFPFLHKPFSKESLLTKVREALAHRP